MTLRGFEVNLGGRVSQVPTIEDALDFAQKRLHRAMRLRELSWSCE